MDTPIPTFSPSMAEFTNLEDYINNLMQQNDLSNTVAIRLIAPKEFFNKITFTKPRLLSARYFIFIKI